MMQGMFGFSRTGWVLSGVDQLGAILKMHGIIMVPLAAPDKAILFKNINDNLRDTVLIFNYCVLCGAFAGPLPVVRIGGVDVYRHAETVHTVAVGAVNFTPIKCAANVDDIFLQLRVFIQFFRDLH